MRGSVPAAAQQSALAAELLALLQVLEHARDPRCPPTVHVDCAMLVTAADRGPSTATSTRSAVASWWKEILGRASGKMPKMVKVKAHVSSSEAAKGTAIEQRHANANNAVDAFARRGAASHRVSEPFRVRHARAWTLFNAFIRYAAAALVAASH